MVVPRADGIPQCREPGTFDHGGVGRELGAGYAPGIKSLDIIWVCAQSLLFELKRSGYQVLNQLLYFGIGRTMGRGNKTVVGILPGIQHAHAKELAEENYGQQVVHGEGIIRMPPQNLVKLQHSAVVVEIVEVIERG